jgi:hypothetical protein
MKTIGSCIAAMSLWMAAPAFADTYIGSWENTTFDTTGALTIEFTKTKTKVSGSIDFDGPVFGAGDPPKMDFSAPLESDGSGKFKIKGTMLGTLNGTFTADGKLTMSIVKVPGFITDASIKGKFDLKAKTFTATYKIDSTEGPLAEGVANAHVPTAPKIKCKRKVAFEGTTAKITVNVATNTTIKSVTATADGGAVVKVKGNNPYQISLKNIESSKVNLTITATTDDDLSKSKTVVFTRTGTLANAVADLILDAGSP